MFALIKISEEILPVSAGEHLVFERLKSTGIIDEFFDLFICLPDLPGFDFAKDIGGVCVDIKIGKQRFKRDKPEFFLHRICCCQCCLSIGENKYASSFP